ncbi:hypothetical protein [Neobacillus niacini]|uniref:hypothetical protein n=1 Tax=Neobacillus niacini TaxID=86668 RepID=UPI0021CB1B2A|nr:hypothetical protein [Neobacillus niacini]MCM3768484.1 hypothetical protein [Neobacillus niacini]
MAISFSFGAINVNQQNTNAGVNVGENQQFGWSSHRKTNNGVGQQAGVFWNITNWTNIIDNDLFDAQIVDPDILPGVQGQSI